MLKRPVRLARIRATAVPFGVMLLFAGCTTGTDKSESGDQPGTGQMPVGAGGSGVPVAMNAGNGTMAGPGAAANGAPPVGTGMAGSAAGPGAGTGVAPGGSGSAGMDAPQAGSGVAGSGETAGSGEPEAGAGGDEPVMHEDLGQGDGKDVITIGDSWMNLILSGIEQSLERISGRDYRNYSAPGTLVLNEQIPGQYESAKGENSDIKTVVMTGGGNDILTSGCADEACNSIVDDVSDRLSMLMSEMASDGVQDIVLIGYTYPDDMTKHASLDHSRMVSATLCTETTMPRCFYLDSTMLDLTLRDGIHPDDAGYDTIGKAVWDLMQAKGMRR